MRGARCPPGVETGRPPDGRPTAARRPGAASTAPPIERWTGPVDVVHGPNFVVPPARRAREVVTVHDLTVLRLPSCAPPTRSSSRPLIRRALRRGREGPHRVGVRRRRGRRRVRRRARPGGGHPQRRDAPRPTGRRGATAARWRRASATSWPSAPSSPARTCPCWSGVRSLGGEDPDLKLVIAGPDGWGADQLPRGRAARRTATGSSGSAGSPTTTATPCCGAPPSSPTRRSTRASACRRSRPWPPARPWSPPAPARSPRWSATPPCWCRRRRRRAGRRARQVLADTAWPTTCAARARANLARFSWDRTATELGALYHRLAGLRSRPGSRHASPVAVKDAVA